MELLRKKLLGSKHFRRLAGLALADAAMFGLTNARNVPSIGLMAGFLLLAATLYYVISGLLPLARLYGLKIRRPRRLAVIITGLVAGLVALQSIGELSSLDVLVLLPLVIIGYVYGSYNRGTAAEA